MIDLLNHALSAVKDINQVVAPETGRVDERLYEHVETKIHKARRMASEGRESKPLVYYAKSVLADFGPAIPERDQADIRKKINHLEKMIENSTYEENIQAIEDLDGELNKLVLVNQLMHVQKAGIISEEKDPSGASKFFRAIEDILRAIESEDGSKAIKILEEIYPDVNSVIKTYDEKAGVIYKDISR